MRTRPGASASHQRRPVAQAQGGRLAVARTRKPPGSVWRKSDRFLVPFPLAAGTSDPDNASPFGLAKPVGVSVPGAPVNAGQAAEIGRQRAPGLPIVLHDDLLGLRDLSIQLGNQLSGLLNGLWMGDLADRELGGLAAPEGLAVLSDLRPMPSDLAVTIRSHLIPLTRAKRDTIHFRFGTIWRFHVAPLRRPDAWAPGRERRLESQPICAVR